jgi:uncharacterized protein YceK
MNKNILYVVALMATSLSGCSLLMPIEVPTDKYVREETGTQYRSTFTPQEEVWHGLNLIDMSQTAGISKNPYCYREADPITKNIIGEHPSETGAVAVSVAYALGYRAISEYLERKSVPDENGENTSYWYATKHVWYALTLATKLITVADNHAIGLRPFGSIGCKRPM